MFTIGLEVFFLVQDGLRYDVVKMKAFNRREWRVRRGCDPSKLESFFKVLIVQTELGIDRVDLVAGFIYFLYFQISPVLSEIKFFH